MKKQLVLAIVTLAVSFAALAEDLVENRVYSLAGKNYMAMKSGTNMTLVEITAPVAVAPAAAPVPLPPAAPQPVVTAAAPTTVPAATTYILGNVYNVNNKNMKCVAVQTVQVQKPKSAGTWSTIRTYGGNTAVGALVGGFGTSKNKTQNTLVGAGGQLATTANTDARISEKIEANNGTETEAHTSVVAEGPSTPVTIGQAFGGGFVQLVPCNSKGVITRNKDGSVKM